VQVVRRRTRFHRRPLQASRTQFHTPNSLWPGLACVVRAVVLICIDAKASRVLRAYAVFKTSRSRIARAVPDTDNFTRITTGSVSANPVLQPQSRLGTRIICTGESNVYKAIFFLMLIVGCFLLWSESGMVCIAPMSWKPLPYKHPRVVLRC
jgi:hypothetical protein